MTELSFAGNALLLLLLLLLLILMPPWLLMLLVVSGVCDFLEWRRSRGQM